MRWLLLLSEALRGGRTAPQRWGRRMRSSRRREETYSQLAAYILNLRGIEMPPRRGYKQELRTERR
jgi:hypothetical protein